MANELLCTNCGAKGKPKKIAKGSFVLEVVLWLLLIVPGIIYSFWRLTSKQKVCPICKAPNMIPLSSPMAQKIMAQ
ncbi:hypothetical protein SAMN05660653_00146 [Desulfonatronum thiosulfatophilum]|uniref:Proteolipid membrane potential modulator n=1 Tax=Desulfonatronum thiosulfatophilum TaxID=617002 RepID=A0A1G6A502_9BACT|nr:YqaE/Pmp3 family membrane protein [Desulfonatronum thiosulfatophilum]SDB03346.1 hypothetical protein SAMN05660653_00146 [Desulfonatronum thiosulfatophilum]